MTAVTNDSSLQTGKKNEKSKFKDSMMLLSTNKRAVEQHPHVMWLAKRGIGADGQLPPVRIRETGREFENVMANTNANTITA